eukprot:6750232-Karenia_brevis.AAC.1
MAMRVWQPLHSMYSNLKRYFRIGQGIGECFHAVNGILKGCPVSVVLVNALMSVWARAVEDMVQKSEAVTFADDKYAVVHSRACVTKVAR